MKKFRTVVSVIVMIIASIFGIFVGATFNDSLGGAILFSLIGGIACVIYVMDNPNE